MMRDPRRHLFLARTKEMAKQARTKLTVLMHGITHLLEIRLDKRQIKESTSLPIIPSQDTTNGVKCLLYSKQEFRFFRFFSVSADLITAEGFLVR